MTLRERLNQILPTILPRDPDRAIWGTELATLIAEKGFSDPPNTLRAYFSDMAKDPSSVIAKVGKGHGYYLRPVEKLELSDEPLRGVETQTENGGRINQREEKFRSLFIRWMENEQFFPMHLEHTRGGRTTAGINKWKYPDVVSVEWAVTNDDGSLDKTMLEVRQGLGEQPFRVISTELKIEVTPSTLREVFFQCVSNSKWAHSAQLAIATKVTDTAVTSELERLGASYGVSIISFDLTLDFIDALPDAVKLSTISIEELEGFLARIRQETISSARDRETLDWEHLKDLQSVHPDMKDFLSWVAKCLKDGHAYDRDTWKRMQPRRAI